MNTNMGLYVEANVKITRADGSVEDSAAPDTEAETETQEEAD